MIPKNAITMVGDIRQCWLFVYRAPESQLSRLLPKPLRLVTKDGFGFVNIVVSELAHMRPRCLPTLFGFHYWHVAYRLHVQFSPPNEPEIEGLFFLRSDADSPFMVWAGELLTNFNFHFAKINVRSGASLCEIDIDSPEADAHVILTKDLLPTLTEGSPFQDLEEAATFLKYKPVGISVNGGQVDVLRIIRDERAWRFNLVPVEEARFAYLNLLNAEFEICYEVEPIQYRWNRAVKYALSNRELSVGDGG